MTIGLHTEGSWVAANATTQTVTLPTHSTGDMLVVRVGMKHATLPGDITCDTSGWARIDQHNNGTTASSNGGGDVQIAAFWKIATSAAETNPVITFHASVAATPSCAVATSISPTSGKVFTTPLADAGSIAAATNYTATMGSHISATAGDFLIGFAVTNDNTTLTNPTFTQTGVTFAAVVESPAAALSSATSNDIAADGCYRIANSGTSSAAAVFTGTNSVADVGAAMVIRLREQDPPANVDASVTATGGGVAVASGQKGGVLASTATGGGIVGPAYVAAVLSDGPVGYWRMGEASGAVVDEIGSNDGTATGTTRNVAGALAGAQDDGAITFNGTSDVVRMGDVLDVGATCTYEVWIKRTNTTAALQYIFNKGANQPNIVIDASHFIKVGDENVDLVISTITIADTNWHHLVFTHAGTGSGDNKLYIDSVDRTGAPVGNTFAGNGSSLSIGAAYVDALWFAGTIDEAAIYDTVLSPTRVLAHYNAGLAFATTDRQLVASATGGGILTATSAGAHNLVVTATGGGVATATSTTDRPLSATATGGGVVTVDYAIGAASENHDVSVTATGGGVAVVVAAKDGPSAVTATGAGVATPDATTDRSVSPSATGAGVASPDAAAGRSAAITATGAGTASVSTTSARQLAALLSGGGVYTSDATTARSADVSATGGGVVTISTGAAAETTVTATGGGVATLDVVADRSAAISATGGGSATVSVSADRTLSISATGGGAATPSATSSRLVDLVATGGGVVTIDAEGPAGAPLPEIVGTITGSSYGGTISATSSGGTIVKAPEIGGTIT
jgi:hypothetical protein